MTLRTLGSGSTIFFEALAAGVFFDFSIAIRYETSARTASKSAMSEEASSAQGVRSMRATDDDEQLIEEQLLRQLRCFLLSSPHQLMIQATRFPSDR